MVHSKTCPLRASTKHEKTEPSMDNHMAQLHQIVSNGPFCSSLHTTAPTWGIITRVGAQLCTTLDTSGVLSQYPTVHDVLPNTITSSSTRCEKKKTTHDKTPPHTATFSSRQNVGGIGGQGRNTPQNCTQGYKTETVVQLLHADKVDVGHCGHSSLDPNALSKSMITRTAWVGCLNTTENAHLAPVWYTTKSTSTHSGAQRPGTRLICPRPLRQKEMCSRRLDRFAMTAPLGKNRITGRVSASSSASTLQSFSRSIAKDVFPAGT